MLAGLRNFLIEDFPKGLLSNYINSFVVLIVLTGVPDFPQGLLSNDTTKPIFSRDIQHLRSCSALAKLFYSFSITEKLGNNEDLFILCLED